MGMEKKQKQYGEIFTTRILELQKEGHTRKCIAEILGVNLITIKNSINRHNRREKAILTTAPKQRG